MALAVPAAPAAADRATKLVVGSELRLRAPAADRPPGYEIMIPHGIASADDVTTFIARVGVFLPAGGAPVVFPASVGVRYAPLQGLGPFLGSELGGYLLRPAGPRREDTPAGPQWCWTLRALAGASVRLGRALSAHVYLDAMWVQTPRDDGAKERLFTGFGAGTELRFAFDPAFRLSDMLLKGKAAPEGF